MGVNTPKCYRQLYTNEGLAQGPCTAVRVGFEPATFRTPCIEHYQLRTSESTEENEQERFRWSNRRLIFLCLLWLIFLWIDKFANRPRAQRGIINHIFHRFQFDCGSSAGRPAGRSAVSNPCQLLTWVTDRCLCWPLRLMETNLRSPAFVYNCLPFRRRNVSCWR